MWRKREVTIEAECVVVTGMLEFSEVEKIVGAGVEGRGSALEVREGLHRLLRW